MARCAGWRGAGQRCGDGAAVGTARRGLCDREGTRGARARALGARARGTRVGGAPQGGGEGQGRHLGCSGLAVV